MVSIWEKNSDNYQLLNVANVKQLHIQLEYILYNVHCISSITYTVDMYFKRLNNKYLKQNGRCILLLPYRYQGDRCVAAKDFVGLVTTVYYVHLHLQKPPGFEKMK